MAASAFALFKKNTDNLDMTTLASGTFKMCLLTSGAALDTHIATDGWSLYGDVTTDANELATDHGYTSGGVALTTPTVTANSGKTGWEFKTDNVEWTASTGSIPAFRYAVLYMVGTVWGMVNPLIGYILCDNTAGGTDIPATTDGNKLTISCPANGWFDMI